MTREIQNAKITHVNLGFERGAFLSISITVEGSGWGQGFGGVVLGDFYTDAWIRGLLKTFKVENWDDLKGQICRVDHTSAKIYRIGHAIADLWFDPEEIKKEIQSKKETK